MAKRKNVKVLDVNKQNYLNALFTDLEKTADGVSYNDRAEIIQTFINNFPSNEDASTIRNGFEYIGGRLRIHSRKKK